MPLCRSAALPRKIQNRNDIKISSIIFVFDYFSLPLHQNMKKISMMTEKNLFNCINSASKPLP